MSRFRGYVTAEVDAPVQFDRQAVLGIRKIDDIAVVAHPYLVVQDRRGQSTLGEKHENQSLEAAVGRLDLVEMRVEDSAERSDTTAALAGVRNEAAKDALPVGDSSSSRVVDRQQDSLRGNHGTEVEEGAFEWRGRNPHPPHDTNPVEVAAAMCPDAGSVVAAASRGR